MKTEPSNQINKIRITLFYYLVLQDFQTTPQTQDPEVLVSLIPPNGLFPLKKNKQKTMPGRLPGRCCGSSKVVSQWFNVLILLTKAFRHYINPKDIKDINHKMAFKEIKKKERKIHASILFKVNQK